MFSNLGIDLEMGSLGRLSLPQPEMGTLGLTLPGLNFLEGDGTVEGDEDGEVYEAVLSPNQASSRSRGRLSGELPTIHGTNEVNAAASSSRTRRPLGSKPLGSSLDVVPALRPKVPPPLVLPPQSVQPEESVGESVDGQHPSRIALGGGPVFTPVTSRDADAGFLGASASPEAIALAAGLTVHGSAAGDESLNHDALANTKARRRLEVEAEKGRKRRAVFQRIDYDHAGVLDHNKVCTRFTAVLLSDLSS